MFTNLVHLTIGLSQTFIWDNGLCLPLCGMYKTNYCFIQPKETFTSCLHPFFLFLFLSYILRRKKGLKNIHCKMWKLNCVLYQKRHALSSPNTQTKKKPIKKEKSWTMQYGLSAALWSVQAQWLSLLCHEQHWVEST